MGVDRGPVAQATGDRTPNVIFFGICKEVPGPGEGPVAHPRGDRVSPTQGATGFSHPI